MEQKYSWMRTFLERFFFANAPIYPSTFLLRPDLLGKLSILIKNFHWQRLLSSKLSFQYKLDKIFVCTHSEHTLTLHCITGPGKQELHLTPGVTGSWLEQSFSFFAGQPHISRWSFNQLWLSGLHQTTLFFFCWPSEVFLSSSSEVWLGLLPAHLSSFSLSLHELQILRRLLQVLPSWTSPACCSTHTESFPPLAGAAS